MKTTSPQFSFRVTEEQRNEIEKQAEAYGISATTLIKRRAMTLSPSNMSDMNQIANDLNELKASVIRTECRINEIAQDCAGSNTLSESNYQELKDLLNQIIDGQKEMIHELSTGSRVEFEENKNTDDKDDGLTYFDPEWIM